MDATRRIRWADVLLIVGLIVIRHVIMHTLEAPWQLPVFGGFCLAAVLVLVRGYRRRLAELRKQDEKQPDDHP